MEVTASMAVADATAVAVGLGRTAVGGTEVSTATTDAGEGRIGAGN